MSNLARDKRGQNTRSRIYNLFSLSLPEEQNTAILKLGAQEKRGSLAFHAKTLLTKQRVLHGLLVKGEVPEKNVLKLKEKKQFGRKYKE